METDTDKFKLGDGATTWTALAYGGVQGPAGADGADGTNGADGADGAPGNTLTSNNQTGTTYTLVLADHGKDVRCSNAAAITLTVPPNSSVAFPLGALIAVSQSGAGAVTATAGAGVTLHAPFGAATTAQYDQRVLEKVATNEWVVR